MSPQVYYLLHVGSAFLLAALTFQAFAAPTPEKRRQTLMLTGILSLVLVVGGFGLLAKLSYGFDGWVLIKIVCWLALSALAGMAFRKPQSAGTLAFVASFVIVLALYAVYFKPF